MSNHDGPTQPMLCHNGCGFFGSADRRNLCSKCYNEFVRAQNPIVEPVVAVPVPESVVVPDVVVPELTTSSEATPTTTIADAPAVKPVNRSRCTVCRKKLRLAQQFECMCKAVFCGEHRYADAHDCQFDYMKRHQDQLRKDNPEVIAAKIHKI